MMDFDETFLSKSFLLETECNFLLQNFSFAYLYIRIVNGNRLSLREEVDRVIFK
jgi:hypothetical protein